MGFGHRVYKNYDPRAKIIKKACDEVLSKLHISDPLLDIAKHLEEAALKDSYFVERKLYPNVDFYSGIIMRALGHSDGDVPGDFCDWPDARLDRELQGNHGGTEEPHLPSAADLHRAHAKSLRAAGRAEIILPSAPVEYTARGRFARHDSCFILGHANEKNSGH